jgi:site-specific DNA-methyltransferase (adenine-specific)
MTYTLHTGDCRDVMATLPAESVDAIVCDPPYGLSFMGKGWDHGVPGVDFWVEALRVLKPGGHLIAFGGTRTYHRLAVAIEDAGFEVRDCLMWLYGSGFPKSLDVSKAMGKQAGAERDKIRHKARPETSGTMAANSDTRPWIEQSRIAGYHEVASNNPITDLAKEWHGWGTALKPAYEPAILARKPLRGTVADNVAQWGVGGLNIDGCRVAYASDNDKNTMINAKWTVRTGITDNMSGTGGFMTSNKDGQVLNGADHTSPLGRWPANVILDEEAAAALDAQSGVGGASRFFYTAKASRSEREAGLDGVEAKPISNAKHGGNMMGSEWVHDSRHPEGGYKTAITAQRANHHPTVKPIALMRYMIRLVAPRGAVVLDPFMGSGSTGCAAMVEGMQFVGIDITPEYVDIARRRLAWWSSSSPLDNMATMELHEENDV